MKEQIFNVDSSMLRYNQAMTKSLNEINDIVRVLTTQVELRDKTINELMDEIVKLKKDPVKK